MAGTGTHAPSTYNADYEKEVRRVEFLCRREQMHRATSQLNSNGLAAGTPEVAETCSKLFPQAPEDWLDDTDMDAVREQAEELVIDEGN